VSTLEELCNPTLVSPADLRRPPLNLPRDAADRLARAARDAKEAEQVEARMPNIASRERERAYATTLPKVAGALRGGLGIFFLSSCKVIFSLS
jgi:hypothetical protein